MPTYEITATVAIVDARRVVVTSGSASYSYDLTDDAAALAELAEELGQRAARGETIRDEEYAACMDWLEEIDMLRDVATR